MCQVPVCDIFAGGLLDLCAIYLCNLYENSFIIAMPRFPCLWSGKTILSTQSY